MAMTMAMGGSCRLRPPSSRTRVTSHLISSMIQTFFFKPNKNTTISHPHFIASSSSFSSSVSPISTSSFSPISHKPQIPLFLRPPIYSGTLLDLHNFFIWAKTLASSVGSTFVEIDNGPDSSLLLRELNWFLEDTIQDSSFISHLGTSQIDGLSSKMVGLRASLDQMYKLWQQRIEERRPFQYIVGCEHWRDLVLSVEEGVLIPRPETEKIVTLVEDVVCTNEALKGGIWADLGTGSGALAIAISRILGNNGRVFAIDLSPIAVSVASYNVERYALQVSFAAYIFNI